MLVVGRNAEGKMTKDDSGVAIEHYFAFFIFEHNQDNSQFYMCWIWGTYRIPWFSVMRRYRMNAIMHWEKGSTKTTSKVYRYSINKHHIDSTVSEWKYSTASFLSLFIYAFCYLALVRIFLITEAVCCVIVSRTMSIIICREPLSKSSILLVNAIDEKSK